MERYVDERWYNPAVASPAALSCKTLDSINYETGANPPPDEDFRWILNLEGINFHEKELRPAVFGSQNVIRLRGGEYFFRTAVRANNDFIFKRSGGGKDPKDFRRIGAIARASLFLANNQGVKLSWQDGTQEEDRVLTLTKATGSTYEIYIENTPLYRNAPNPNQSQFPEFDELIEYYRVVTEILPTTLGTSPARFKLIPTRSPIVPLVEGESAPDSGLAGSDAGELREAQKGSPAIPCQVMTLDGPSN